MAGAFKKLCCWLSGHEWETLQLYTVDVSPIGRGIIQHRKCARCGEEQNLFECTASFGSAKEAYTPFLKPSNMRVISSYEEEEAKKKCSKSECKNVCSTEKATKKQQQEEEISTSSSECPEVQVAA